MATHPANAVFVSGDREVSFNENGRKLDSLGNVVWGDYQGLRGANARVRPEILRAYEEEEKQRQAQAQQPAPVQPYRPPATMEQSAPPPTQSNPWAGISQWRTGTQPQQPPMPAWEPPPSGLGMQSQPNWNRFQPQRPAQITDPQSMQAYDLLSRYARPQEPEPQPYWNQFTPRR